MARSTAIIKRHSSGYGTISLNKYSPKERIQRNYTFLMEHLLPDELCDYLLQKGCLDDQDVQYIQVPIPLYDKCDRFLQKLLVKIVNEKTYDYFAYSLIKCEQTHILQRLEKTLFETEDFSNVEMRETLRFLFLPQNALEDTDGLKLARRCLENFVIDVREYIDIYNTYNTNMSEARQKLITILFDMPNLIIKVPGFIRALKSDADLNEEYIRWFIPKMKKSGRGFNKFKMTMYIRDASLATKLENGIKNKHPEIIWLFAKKMQAYDISPRRGSLVVEFKGLTEFIHRELDDDNNGRLFHSFQEFLAHLLLASDARRAEFDINVKLIGQRNRDFTTTQFLKPTLSELIRRRGQMVKQTLKKEDYAGYAWKYINNSRALIDLIVKTGKQNLFFEHVKNEEMESTFQAVFLGGSECESVDSIDFEQKLKLIDHKKYLCYIDKYLEDVLDLLPDNPSDALCLQLMKDIEAMEDRSFFTRIKWTGSHAELLRGFLLTYETLVSYNNVKKLIDTLDPRFFHQKTQNDWRAMATVDKRITMVILMDHVFKGDYEFMTHFYDTLCNLLEFDLVDTVRERGTSVSRQELEDNDTVEKLCYHGDLKIKVY